MYILGISAFYHDSAAALIRDGVIVAAAQEERFTRKKHDSSYPEQAIDYCLAAAQLTLSEINHVVFYDKPFIKFERLLETYVAFSPRGFKSFSMALPLWLHEKLFQKNLLIKELSKNAPDYDWGSRLLFAEHHQSHAASAFYPSPFKDAVTLTMDGVGEWATTSIGFGRDNNLEMLREIHFPHSLGLLYSAFTYYLGFKVNSGEYKVMGLAPYGNPKYSTLILDKLLDLKEDGSFRLDQNYFDYCTGLTMTNHRFSELFGGTPREPKEALTQRHMDLAASIQVVIEEVVLRITRALAKEGLSKNLCLAGGVALNCVANGKVLRDGKFENLWTQPASGDAGGAIGAALSAYYGFFKNSRKVNKNDEMQGGYLGPQYSQSEIENQLSSMDANYETLSDNEMLDVTVDALVAGKAIGWFQGRMEFGPRALGNRSILGDPRNENMQKTLNLKVKYRESFRPFAPSILYEDVKEWFDLDCESPYMLLVADVLSKHHCSVSESDDKLIGLDKLNVSRSEIPAVTHVDYSSRVQTVHRDTNPIYHALLQRFKQRTGCPIIVNTSFNIRSEPIVCTPEDAFRCFMGCDIELLVIGNSVLHKEKQAPELKVDYRSKFTPD
jgi:carbamoyltransferase